MGHMKLNLASVAGLGLGCLLVGPLSGSGLSRGQAATQLAGGATTAASSRPGWVLPEGFVRLEVGGRKFLVTPDEEKWVREAAEHVVAASRPTTMPEDLLATLAGQKDDIVARLAADLAVDPKMTEEWVSGSGDRTLKGVLEKFAGAKTFTVFLVGSIDRVSQAMEGGWETPTLRYNRQMKKLVPSQTVVLADTEDSPYVIQPVLYDAATRLEEERAGWLEGQLSEFDHQVANTRSEDGMRLVQASMIYFAGDRGFGGLTLRPDQEWLKAGVVGAVTAKYTSLVTGVPRRRIVTMMTYERRGMLHTTAVDLLAPMEAKDMVPELIPAYASAVSRKSIKVIDELTLHAGDGAIGKIMAAVKEKKPADGAALVALVREITGVDLTAQLRSGQ